MVTIYAKEISSIPLYHQYQSKPLIKSRMDPISPVVYATPWPCQQMSQQNLRFIRLANFFSMFCCTIFVASVSCSRLTVVVRDMFFFLFFSAVSHLLQGSIYCDFRDAFVYTSVVKSWYCWLFDSLNQPDHSPPTSFIKNNFWLKNCRSPYFFSFFWLYSINTGDGCAWKS